MTVLYCTDKVFSFFEDICAIPHGSGNPDGISGFLCDFAKKRNLRFIVDGAKNVIIFKDASKGYEKASPVMLQGHMDMVTEKEKDCKKDMQKEGIDLIYDGDFISADKTTLGADDSIAVAMILSVLDSDIPSPPIEAVFTTDEEVGMLGAIYIDASPLKSKTMINLDSEAEGVLTVSCSGGNITKSILPIKHVKNEKEAIKITISNLTGGHSGVEIINGRANANELMSRLLMTLYKKADIALCSFNGGVKDNAIPVYAEAVVTADDTELAAKVIQKAASDYKNEFSSTDPDMEVSYSPLKCDARFDDDSTKRTVFMLSALPNGVYSMSPDINGLVQTSLNMGIVKTNDNEAEVCFCVRSSIESQRDMLTEKISAIASLAGGEISVSGDYPGWQYKKDSPIRRLIADVYRSQTNKEPVIEAVHAGLECGIFSGKIKELDCISIGPDIFDIHTVNERLSISSVKRTYDLVCEVLSKMNV